MLDCAQTAALLQGWDKILVMSHASPQVDFLCADPVPEKFSYLFAGLPLGGFEPAHVMTVDVADKKLLGKPTQEGWSSQVELAVDHHGTHVPFAPQRWVEPEAAATTEMIFALLGALGVKITPAMADSLYTGLTTDTGCFRYRNPPHCGGPAGAGRPKRGYQPADV